MQTEHIHVELNIVFEISMTFFNAQSCIVYLCVRHFTKPWNEQMETSNERSYRYKYLLYRVKENYIMVSFNFAFFH